MSDILQGHCVRHPPGTLCQTSSRDTVSDILQGHCVRHPPGTLCQTFSRDTVSDILQEHCVRHPPGTLCQTSSRDTVSDTLQGHCVRHPPGTLCQTPSRDTVSDILQGHCVRHPPETQTTVQKSKRFQCYSRLIYFKRTYLGDFQKQCEKFPLDCLQVNRLKSPGRDCRDCPVNPSDFPSYPRFAYGSFSLDSGRRPR